jgi:hypothetical protein
MGSSGQTTVQTFLVGGRNCSDEIEPRTRIESDCAGQWQSKHQRGPQASGISITLTPLSTTYTLGQTVRVTVTGGTTGVDYSVLLFENPPANGTDLSSFLSASSSQGPGNQITWGTNTSEYFDVTFDAYLEGLNRVLEVTDNAFTNFVDSPLFAIQDCSSASAIVTASISANPSLTIAQGQTVALSASGNATSYALSNRVATAGTTFTPQAVGTASFSVTGSTGACSATASVVITSTPVLSPQTFNFIGGLQTWIVPANVYKLRIVALGRAGGANNDGVAGGAGGKVDADMAATPGQSLTIYVGGTGRSARLPPNTSPPRRGVGGYNGGGNGADGQYVDGGATDIRINGSLLSNRVVVAGGAGGGITGGNGSDYRRTVKNVRLVAKMPFHCE